MDGADFEEASLATEDKDADIDFEDAYMNGASFKKASLATEGKESPIDFYEADLTGASFTKASLTTEGDDSDIDFRNADLTDAEFAGAHVDASGSLYNDPTAPAKCEEWCTNPMYDDADWICNGADCAGCQKCSPRSRRGLAEGCPGCQK